MDPCGGRDGLHRAVTLCRKRRRHGGIVAGGLDIVACHKPRQKAAAECVTGSRGVDRPAGLCADPEPLIDVGDERPIGASLRATVLAPLRRQ